MRHGNPPRFIFHEPLPASPIAIVDRGYQLHFSGHRRVEYAWMKTAQNTYGAFINAGLRDGFMSAAARFGNLVIVGWLSQGVVCLYLYGIARATCKAEEDWMWDCVMENDNGAQCAKVGGVVTWVAVMVLSSTMTAQLPGMLDAMQIVMNTQSYKDSGSPTGSPTPVNQTEQTRWGLIIMGPFAEFIIWIFFFHLRPPIYFPVHKQRRGDPINSICCIRARYR